MDLEAMIETIESKNDMESRKNQLHKRLLANKNDVAKLQNGTSFIGKFKSKNDIINKITDLTERVEREEKEIDCADVLTKIIFLYL